MTESVVLIMSNKRIRKKHYWLGEKRAGTNHCRNTIGNGIRLRYIEATDTEPKRRNIMRYLRWFYIHSSLEEWCAAVKKYHVNTQLILSAKHLLSQPITPIPSSLQDIECNHIYRDAYIRSFDRIRKGSTGTLIFYRPHRGSLTESLQELEIFTSVDEMFDFIIENQPFDDTFDKSDLSVGEDIGPDERIGWSETRYVLTKRCCGNIYDTPQCIGMCSFEKITKENSNNE